MAAIVGLVLGACGGQSPPPVAPAAPASATPPAPSPPVPAAAAAPPLHGAQLADIDRKADPCTDFFQFANGAWRAANPIPASMPKWSRRWESGETNKEHLKQLLEELAAAHDAPHGSAEQIVGDFYGACTDEAHADALGVTPLAPFFAELDAIKTRADVERAIVHLHAIGIRVGFGLGADQDLHDPTHMLATVAAAGLGLPDRDYYVKTEPRFVEARAKYRTHMTTMFALAGRKASPAALDAVFALETTLAKASLDNVALRDPKKLDHPTTFAALGKLAPHIDWTAYFDASHLPKTDLNVAEPGFLAALDHALAAAPVDVWKTYLTWHLLRSAAPYLSHPLVDETFAFDDAYLAGKKENKPRWKRCAETADELFGDALGKKYVAKYFPPEAKARVRAMVDNILLATGDKIRGATWMSDETKQRALTKLGTFNTKVGYPDVWKDYSSVTVTRDALWNDVVAGRRFVVADDRAQIGKPVDRARWGMTPPTSNAYYNPQLNEIVFPAGILQPPMFDMTATDAVNYGAIGVVIGHEVSHGFDDQGAQFDEKGALSNWWTPADHTQFDARGKCVSDQFDGYFIEPGIHHNGKLVLGESIGDLGGVTIAWLAFQKSLAGGTAPTIDGFTPAQQFFLGYGQSRGDEIRPETQRLMIQGDPHPVAKFRVIGPLSNTPDFARAFSCKADAPMARPEDKRCTVW
jgi:endothelin-converting enzyme/putative endopeptidase